MIRPIETQPAFTCSKSIIETLEHCEKSVQRRQNDVQFFKLNIYHISYDMFCNQLWSLFIQLQLQIT